MDSALSAPPPASLAGSRDEAGRAMGHRHDGDHGVDARRAGEGATVGDKEALDGMHLVVRADDGCRRIIAHATRAHLVEAHVAHLARAVAVAVDFVHERLDAATLAGAVADVRGLAGEDLLRTGGLEDANAGFDSLPHVDEVGARELVLDPGSAVLRDDPAGTTVPEQDARQGQVWQRPHQPAVSSGLRQGVTRASNAGCSGADSIFGPKCCPSRSVNSSE